MISILTDSGAEFATLPADKLCIKPRVSTWFWAKSYSPSGQKPGQVMREIPASNADGLVKAMAIYG